jgi:Lrp/AsnC family leucine-responsive transcriptional regulator
MALDDLDRRLLDLVQNNSRASHADLGRAVGLSTSAVQARLQRLKDEGVIQAYTARVDPAAVGLNLLAFVLVLVNHPRHEIRVLDAVKKLPQVLECHHVTGDYSYLLKIRAPDTAALQDVLTGLKNMPGVNRTLTLVALSTTKETAALAIEPRGEGL